MADQPINSDIGLGIIDLENHRENNVQADEVSGTFSHQCYVPCDTYPKLINELRVG